MQSRESVTPLPSLANFSTLRAVSPAAGRVAERAPPLTRSGHRPPVAPTGSSAFAACIAFELGRNLLHGVEQVGIGTAFTPFQRPAPADHSGPAT